MVGTIARSEVEAVLGCVRARALDQIVGECVERLRREDRLHAEAIRRMVAEAGAATARRL